MERRKMLKSFGVGAAAGVIGMMGGTNISLAHNLFLQPHLLSQFPEAEINNGIIRAKIYLPDQTKGYYQSTRFDWSGVVSSLEFKGHQYFGEWFEKHDPKVNDAITGPVEEFTPVGYEEANPGDSFLKIGVGILQKTDDVPYRFFLPFEVVDYGKWSMIEKKDQVEFVHEMTDTKGYAYNYQKKLKLVKDKPEMVLEHSLKNTGTKKIDTKVYNHNFFMLDNQKIGPDYSVTFPFDISLIKDSRGLGSIVEIQKNKIRFLRTLDKGESAQLFLEGFSQKPEDYDVQIENSKTGSGVRITSDRPISELAFWCMENTICPEPYIKVDVDPGKEMTWQIKYAFYTQAFG